jgi:hypothetical protein
LPGGGYALPGHILRSFVRMMPSPDLSHGERKKHQKQQRMLVSERLKAFSDALVRL